VPTAAELKPRRMSGILFELYIIVMTTVSWLLCAIVDHLFTHEPLNWRTYIIKGWPYWLCMGIPTVVLIRFVWSRLRIAREKHHQH
jgi:hypothetical protein